MTLVWWSVEDGADVTGYDNGTQRSIIYIRIKKYIKLADQY